MREKRRGEAKIGRKIWQKRDMEERLRKWSGVERIENENAKKMTGKAGEMRIEMKRNEDENKHKWGKFGKEMKMKMSRNDNEKEEKLNWKWIERKMKRKKWKFENRN